MVKHTNDLVVDQAKLLFDRYIKAIETRDGSMGFEISEESVKILWTGFKVTPMEIISQVIRENKESKADREGFRK
jgi:hypothetical protein